MVFNLGMITKVRHSYSRAIQEQFGAFTIFHRVVFCRVTLGITKWWFGTFTIFVSHLTRREIITSFISLRGRTTEMVHYTSQRPSYHSHCPKQTRLHPETKLTANHLILPQVGFILSLW